ncbi:magnesium transporter [Thermococcus barophilus]|uniref:Mg2+ transport protein (Mgte) n=1 Tax=Thermococcus barophilus TaxID=55802 RepID=A0A0S1X9P8_THEBA|nr:magnesium transporter [Thermococcus barophilus]ALM74472.1 Mg2+ transport protein (Mgte) [Thermococcus barophilus]
MTMIQVKFSTESSTLRESVKEALLYSFPALLVCLVLDFVGGSVLGKYFNVISQTFPMLLVIIPGLMDLRGNVFGAMASRFTTMLHLGKIQNIFDKEVTTNISIAMLGTKVPLLLLWFMGLFKVGNLRQAIIVLFIVITSAILIAVVLGYTAAMITVLPYKRGIDPDMIAAPVITSVSDLITIPSLVYLTLLYERHKWEFYLFSLVMFALLLVLIFNSRFQNEHRRVFSEIVFILTLLALIEGIAGGILEEYSKVIGAVVITAVMYPSLLDSLGNFGAIMAAKSSTKLHLGGMEEIKSLSTIYDIAALLSISPIEGVFTNVFALFIVVHVIHKSASLIPAFLITYPLMVLIALILGLLTAIVAYKLSLDPDNVAIPTVTTLTDVIGTVYVVILAKILLN